MTKRKKLDKNKPLAIFDIDGTIFRSSLLIELTKHLVKSGVFTSDAYDELKRKKLRWLDRQGSYEDYIGKVVEVFQEHLCGVRCSDVHTIVQLVIREQKNRVYVYTRELLKKLRLTHHLIAISGSPMEIVDQFKKAWKFNDVFGTEYEIAKGVYTGGVVSVASNRKKEILNTYTKTHGLSLWRSVGVGDTESDIAFLRMVETPIAFNPNKKLLCEARRCNWIIKVERKDVIYTV